MYYIIYVTVYLRIYVFIYLSFYLSFHLFLVEITYDRSCNAEIFLSLMVNGIPARSHSFTMRLRIDGLWVRHKALIAYWHLQQFSSIDSIKSTSLFQKQK